MNKNKLFTIIAVVSLLTIFISLLSMISLTPTIKGKNTSSYKKNRGSFAEIPGKISTDFILKTNSGKKFSFDALRGKFLLIYFGSTYCPDTTLPQIIKMEKILKELNKLHEKDIIEFIFITADPDNDTEPHLKSYFEKFDPRIIVLTEEKDKINKVLENFRAYDTLFKDKIKIQKKENTPQAGECIITNSSSPFYFIGKDGEFIKHYSTQNSSKKIVENILHYIKMF